MTAKNKLKFYFFEICCYFNSMLFYIGAFVSKGLMTYNNFRKIQVYILISLSCFIFTKNIQIIFKTRNIVETDHKILSGVVFLTKTAKNEINANLIHTNAINRSSEWLLEPLNTQYIKDKHSKSLSRSSVVFDKSIFLIKRLINEVIYFLKYLLASVKYRYLLGQKQLEAARKLSLERLEGLVGTRGLPLVKGILFGDISSIDRETYHSFKVIGILHVLSASSANFTIFLHFCLFFARPVLGFTGKKQLFCLHFLIIFTYFTLVGAAASTIRAFLTLSAAFFASFILQRAFLPLINLYIAGVLMLIINPFFLGTLGFQFSFLASFGILFLYEYLEKEPFINNNYLLKSILLTFCAQFFLIPIFIFNFGELNYLAILANFFVLPLVEILTIMFLASFIVLFISSSFSLGFFESFISYLILKTLDILFIVINLLEKSSFKSFLFKGNKYLYVIVFTLINFLAIALVIYLKNKKYSKNKYRIFK